MTRSNQRILLLLKDGSSGLLRLADAERLQVEPVSYLHTSQPAIFPGHISLQAMLLL